MSDENKKQEVDPGFSLGESDETKEGAKETRCEKCDEYLAGWKRALADYDNLQKDLARRSTADRESERAKMALVLIEALDGLDKAVSQQPSSSDEQIDNWINGIGHIRSQIEGSLEQKGIYRLTGGGVFDPDKHHAVGQRSEADAVDGTILESPQDGWSMGEKVIRPAMVIINNIKENK